MLVSESYCRIAIVLFIYVSYTNTICLYHDNCEGYVGCWNGWLHFMVCQFVQISPKDLDTTICVDEAVSLNSIDKFVGGILVSPCPSLCRQILYRTRTWVVFLRIFENCISCLLVKRGGSLSFLTIFTFVVPVIGLDMTENRIVTICGMITWVVFLRMFWNFISSLPVKRGGSLSILVGTISNVLVMEIGWTDVGSGGIS